MKTIRNLILVLALTVTFAFGDDGHTGGGGRCDTCTPPACTENCGGFAGQDPETDIVSTTETDDDDETSLIDYWSKAFFELIG